MKALFIIMILTGLVISCSDKKEQGIKTVRGNSIEENYLFDDGKTSNDNLENPNMMTTDNVNIQFIPLDEKDNQTFSLNILSKLNSLSDECIGQDKLEKDILIFLDDEKSQIKVHLMCLNGLVKDIKFKAASRDEINVAPPAPITVNATPELPVDVLISDPDKTCFYRWHQLPIDEVSPSVPEVKYFYMAVEKGYMDSPITLSEEEMDGCPKLLTFNEMDGTTKIDLVDSNFKYEETLANTIYLGKNQYIDFPEQRKAILEYSQTQSFCLYRLTKRGSLFCPKSVIADIKNR